MAENWKCRSCAAVNHPRRNQCWQCGASQFAETKSASPPSIAKTSSKPWRNGVLISVGLVLIFGLILIPFWVDRRNYTKGIQAFKSLDCSNAIESFDQVIDGWRLIDLNRVVSASGEKKAECQAFQTAVDQHSRGNFSAAFLAYRDFVNNYPDSAMVKTVYELVLAMFAQAPPDMWASQEPCADIDSFTETGILPEPDKNLPLFYLACGAIYNSQGQARRSFESYTAFLSEFPQHASAPEAISALTTNPVACREIANLRENVVIVSQTELMPSLYFSCGKSYDNQERSDAAFRMYTSFLMEYPEHALAPKVENALFANPRLCKNYQSLQNTSIAQRDDFMPTLYFRCGQAAEATRDYADALLMFEYFLADYAEHKLADEVEAAYARVIVAQAQIQGTNDLGEPVQIGSMAGSRAQVVIRNASPEKLRIVFSGPDPRVEELEPCTSCRSYFDETLATCPDDAPSGTYRVKAGDYNVVIESLSDPYVTPFMGAWDLKRGNEYFECIILVTTWLP